MKLAFDSVVKNFLGGKLLALAGGVYFGAGLFTNVTWRMLFKALTIDDAALRWILFIFGLGFTLSIAFTIGSWLYFLSRPRDWKLFDMGKRGYLILTAVCYVAGSCLSIWMRSQN